MGCRETLRAGLAAGLLLAAAPAQAQQEAAPPTREVALRDGAATQLQTAVEDLDTGRRAQAVPALDEAYRVLEVASQAANARRLLGIAGLAKDVRFCFQRDTFPVIGEMGAEGWISA